MASDEFKISQIFDGAGLEVESHFKDSVDPNKIDIV